MRMTYKFRLYPTKPQQGRMERMLELCRYAYNKTLETKKNAYDNEHKMLSKYDLNNLLPEWKKETPELKEVFSQTLQEVQERVDLAFKHFFRCVKNGEQSGYPRFKGRGWYDSFTYPQMGFKLNSNKLYLGKIGDVYIVKHREVEGDVKRVCIRRHNNKWYACLTTESEYHVVPSKNNVPAVGVDMGLTSFAVLSDGNTILNPRFFRAEETVLARAQRRLSKCEKGTSEKARARRIVGRIHERIGNRRYDFVHQLSRRLVNEYGFIAFEDLNIKGMVRDHCLAKCISDAAWRMLITATMYKAESAGTTVALVDPAYTSQMCSRCGTIVPKKLNDRVHECPGCGLIMDRDENAAINILRLGLQSVARRDMEAHML